MYKNNIDFLLKVKNIINYIKKSIEKYSPKLFDQKLLNY